MIMINVLEVTAPLKVKPIYRSFIVFIEAEYLETII